MTIAVAGGKGGTGKTLFAMSLARSLEGRVCVFDADAEGPNAHLFCGVDKTETKPYSVQVPVFDISKCDSCGKCVELCRFKALAFPAGRPLLFQGLCHSCGGCAAVCKTGAVTETGREIGEISIYEKDDFRLVSGALNVGEPMSPPLIHGTLEEGYGQDGISIIDCPPGASCGLAASIKTADYCLLIVENTPFGLHDVKIVMEVLLALNIPFGAIINKWRSEYSVMEKLLNRDGVEVLMRVPFSEDIAKAYSEGRTLLDLGPAYENKFKEIAREISERLDKLV